MATASLRADGAGNFKFEDVMAQRDEAGAEPGGPFPGIGDMGPTELGKRSIDGWSLQLVLNVIFMTGSNRV